MNPQKKPPVSSGQPPQSQPVDMDVVAEIEQLTNQLKRAQADFVNYKKRIDRDQADFVQASYADVLLQFLPVVDSFTRVIAHVPENLKSDEWVKGVLNTAKQFADVLKQMGVEKMQVVGSKADPALHEVVAAGPGEADMVVEELEPGYLFRGKTLRPARVRVGTGI